MDKRIRLVDHHCSVNREEETRPASRLFIDSCPTSDFFQFKIDDEQIKVVELRTTHPLSSHPTFGIPQKTNAASMFFNYQHQTRKNIFWLLRAANALFSHPSCVGSLKALLGRLCKSFSPNDALSPKELCGKLNANVATFFIVATLRHLTKQD